MNDAKPEPIVCRLCGGPIGKAKGEREEAYKQELAMQVHHSCSEKHETILTKHKVKQEDYTSALFEAMTQVLRLENTEAMKAFAKRVEDATKEAHEEFPYLAAMAQSAQPQPQAVKVMRAPNEEKEATAKKETKK